MQCLRFVDNLALIILDWDGKTKVESLGALVRWIKPVSLRTDVDCAKVSLLQNQ